MTLAFNPELHEYRFNGVPVPSVTQIIAPLYSWSRINPEVLAAKAQLGTYVHLACELDDKGTLDVGSLDPAIAGYLSAYRRFKEEVRPIVLFNEVRLYNHERGYAGQIDRVYSMRGGIYVADLKATVALYPQVGVQLAGYESLLKVNYPEFKFVRRAALQLRPDGTYGLGNFKDASDWAAFAGLLALHHWKKDHGNCDC